MVECNPGEKREHAAFAGQSSGLHSHICVLSESTGLLIFSVSSFVLCGYCYLPFLVIIVIRII